MKKFNYDDIITIVTVIVAMVISVIPLYFIYLIYSGIFYLLNKLIDKI